MSIVLHKSSQFGPPQDGSLSAMKFTTVFVVLAAVVASAVSWPLVGATCHVYCPLFSTYVEDREGGDPERGLELRGVWLRCERMRL
jgi:hypothetical protein